MEDYSEIANQFELDTDSVDTLEHKIFYLLHSKYCVSFKIVLHRHLNDFIKIYLTTEQ